MFLGPCPAVPLFCPLLASKGLMLSPGLTALGPALAPVTANGGQKRDWQIKTKCRSCSKQLLGEEPTAGSTGLGASFMIPCLIPGKTHKAYLQPRLLGREGITHWVLTGTGWRATRQTMKFFGLETKFWFLGRLWSQGATTSIMAREEGEAAIGEAGLTGMTGGSSPSSLGRWNPHFHDLPPKTCVQAHEASQFVPCTGPGHT